MATAGLRAAKLLFSASSALPAASGTNTSFISFNNCIGVISFIIYFMFITCISPTSFNDYISFFSFCISFSGFLCPYHKWSIERTRRVYIMCGIISEVVGFEFSKHMVDPEPLGLPSIRQSLQRIWCVLMGDRCYSTDIV